MSRTRPTAQFAAPPQEVLTAISSAAASVRARPTDRLAAAHDASHYVLAPQVVVAPLDVAEVRAVMAASSRIGLPVTFRSGGTSLSGQASGAGVLVDTRRHFRSVEVLDDGRRVRTGPGATVRAVNNRLLRHGRKLGPDPASEIACTIGGVIANNSSGMSCGIHANSYQTLDSAVFVLPTGTIIDTSLEDADQRLAITEPELHAGLARLRKRVLANTTSVATIRSLFKIKNTMGYSINAFLDFEKPVDILQHLIVGSEGTLAFVAEATFKTVAAKPHSATGLLIFPDLSSATAALPDLARLGFAAIELMDATSLRVAQREPEAPSELTDLKVENHCALLVEHQEDSVEALALRVGLASESLSLLPLVKPASLSSDPARRSALWRIRKGLFALVAGNRAQGTTALLEDIAVPVDRLLPTCNALTALFAAHGYEDAVIFGHAKDGNIHFMICERFGDPTSLDRYKAFTDQMVSIVLTQGGTLKAEHGTGRMMAPFVRRQYGDELYEVMREVKRLIDPAGVLNPGVLLNDDPQAHMKNLKVAPQVEAEVDRCVECGYCEPVCPSRDYTLTPRERIVLRREIASAETRGDEELAAALRNEYRHDGTETCAVDGMCQTACPVSINTGDLVRRLRAENTSGLEQLAWRTAARSWDAASVAGGAALTLSSKLPAALPGAATRAARAILGTERIPQYSADLPAGGKRRRVVRASNPVAVYFPSCTTTLFGASGSGPGVSDAFLRLCSQAGIEVVTPDDIPSMCCGTPWKSKGMADGYAEMKDRVAGALRRATGGGRLPVVCDASSCTEGLRMLLEAAGEGWVRVVDSVAFIAERVLPYLSQPHRVKRLALHPTCSSTRLGLNNSLSVIAAALADEVIIPDDWGCCAFAGDRGMLHPPLTAAATAPEAACISAAQADAYASLNRTCELGMSRATGESYRHILEILQEATDPR